MTFRETAAEHIRSTQAATKAPRWLCAGWIYSGGLLFGAVALVVALVGILLCPWRTIPALKRSAARAQAARVGELYGR